MRARIRTTPSFIQGTRGVGAAVLTVGLTLSLAACGAAGSPDAEQSESVTLVVHDSFVDAEAFQQAASSATGYDVKVVTAGDGGELTNKLVLTKGEPIADAFFGVDNSFASRLIDHGVVEPIALTELSAIPERAREFGADLVVENTGDTASVAALPLVPIDFGAVCLNTDTAWFAEKNLPAPSSYEDLTDERYRGLSVLIDPTGSSTGAAFLIGTVAAFGEDGFADYWAKLVANDVRIESGWTEAYNGQFTQGGGDGTFPIVLSYATSPAFTVSEDGSSTSTEAPLGTCTSQVEYAGVLKGASNVKGAEAVIEYLLSREFQDTIAESMYMYPIDEEASVPTEWQRFAAAPTAPHDLSPAAIGAGLEGWLKTWSNAVGW